MNPQILINGRRKRPQRQHDPLASLLVGPPLSGALAYPGYLEPDDGSRTRAFLTGSALLHAAGVALLVLLASLAPVIEEHVIPVQLLKEEPPPAPAPRTSPPPRPGHSRCAATSRSRRPCKRWRRRS